MSDRPQPPEAVPDLDWEPRRARELGERALDIWEELLAKIRDLPVSRHFTEPEVAAAVLRDVPRDPTPIDDLAAYLRSLVFDWSMYPGHPRFMAYITGAGTVPGAAADLLAAAINQNVGGFRLSPSATVIERHLPRWFARRFGLPEGSGGILSTGGAMANFIALKAARDVKAGWDVRAHGVAAGPPLTIYASTEAHDVLGRAADMLGLGRDAVRLVATDERRRLRVDGLREAIAADRNAGARPIAVVGTAGTVGVGAIDPLDDIATVCAEENLWFHIDGAYGAPAALVPSLRPLFAGLERADSVAFDPHKWLYTPHSGGMTVMRDEGALRDAFYLQPAYVHEDKVRTGHGDDLFWYGPQFSRGFFGLKVWLSLLAHGTDAYERRIAHDVALARYLADLAADRAEFEVMSETVLSITTFRFVPPGLPAHPERDAYLDRLNELIMTDLQADGRAFCSNAVLNGRFVLRACIVNFRTEAADVEALLDVAAEIGTALDREMRPEALR